MAIAGTTEWQGERENYDFDVYEFGDELPEDSGVYIYVFYTLQATWAALYVGQTNNLGRRAQEHGNDFKYATHIHFHVESDEDRRDNIENDLINALRPPENLTP